MTVAKMAGSLIGSEIIKIGNEVSEMIKKGAAICNLAIGDFDPAIFPVPEELGFSKPRIFLRFLNLPINP